ncbi:MAG: hypothetical protein PHG65_00585 [Kiritimatiellae bacterium]|nr:hypothetical protein [Kiritimatiellia bacterium]
MKKVAYYVSAHGYGHGVRTCDILPELVARRPDVQMVLTTGLSVSFLEPRLKGLPVSFRAGSFDVGMIQIDSVAVDVPATFRTVEGLFAQRTALVDQEVCFLSEAKADLVVADIPSIPMEAAAKAGIPCVAVGNFGWNWIYSPFAEKDPRWWPLIEKIEEGYRKADLLLRLPFSEPMTVFERQVNIPLLAQPGVSRRAELAEATGADPDKTWVLLSFAALNWTDEVVRRVAGEPGYEFFTVQPLAWEGSGIHSVSREAFSFSDVLASSDAVISKPGYGLLSECIANDKPLVYVDRQDFIEYPILEEAIRRHLRGVHVPQEDLYAGCVRPYLERLEECPPPAEPMERDGGQRVAGELLRLMEPGGSP